METANCKRIVGDKPWTPSPFVLSRINRYRDLLYDLKVEIEAIRDTRTLEDWMHQEEIYLSTRQDVAMRMHRSYLQALRALVGEENSTYEADVIYADNCLQA